MREEARIVFQKLDVAGRLIILFFVGLFVFSPDTQPYSSLFGTVWLAGLVFMPVYHFTVLRVGSANTASSGPVATLAYLFDLIWVTTAVSLSGGLRSPLLLLYFALIVSSALRGGRVGGLTGAISCTAALLAVYFAENVGAVAVGGRTDSFYLGAAISSVWLVALLAGMMAEVLHESLRGKTQLASRNRSLFEAQKREAERMAIINKISKLAGSTLDMIRVCVILARELKKTIDFEQVSISLIDDERDEVESYALSSSGEVLEREVTRPTESCCAHWVTRYKKPLMRPDLTKGLQLDADAKLAAQGLRTCFSLPLTSRDRVIGTLSFYGRERNAFTDRDVEILVPLSEQLSIAIENARLYGKVKRQANTDQLTGLYNYGFFQQFLEKELLRAARYKKDLSVVMLDLDGFKNYNDTFGHPAGDVVLKKMAAILLKCVREADIAARYGGDEFVLILPETGVEGARMLTDRIRSQFEHDDHIKKARSEAELGVSIGIAAYPAMAHSKEELIRLADDFLYGSKKIKQHKEIVF